MDVLGCDGEMKRSTKSSIERSNEKRERYLILLLVNFEKPHKRHEAVLEWKQYYD